MNFYKEDGKIMPELTTLLLMIEILTRFNLRIEDTQINSSAIFIVFRIMTF